MLFVVLLGLVVLIVVVMGVSKAKARMHFANEAGAVRDLVEDVGPTLPTWFSNATKLKMFSDGVVRLAERDGMPPAFIRLALSNPKSNAPIFAYAAKLEHRGSSFAEQQLGTCRYLLTTWEELDASTQAKVARMISI